MTGHKVKLCMPKNARIDNVGPRKVWNLAYNGTGVHINLNIK